MRTTGNAGVADAATAGFRVGYEDPGYFSRDYNFSLYSYERFFNFPPKEELLSMWEADTQLLVQQYDTRDNLHYFIPYWRYANDSHCTIILTWDGTVLNQHGKPCCVYVTKLLCCRAPAGAAR